MPTFHVHVREVTLVTYEVEADNADQALREYAGGEDIWSDIESAKVLAVGEQ